NRVEFEVRFSRFARTESGGQVNGLERCSRGGGEKGRGTGPCMRRPTTGVLRVVSVPAECRASPTVHLLVWGERVPFIAPFSPPPLDPPPPVARSSTNPRPLARSRREKSLPVSPRNPPPPV